MSSIVSKKPNVKWDDVAGLTPAKHELQRAIVFPARFPNLYDEKRKASGAILLYGPPGTGKSYLAKAVATEVDHTLFSISSGDVVSKWVGESEKLVRQLFTLARENKPSIIFIDEIDALCANREGGGGSERGSEHSSRMKTETLVQLDGLHSGSDNTGVVVLAATNLPWALDPAFRRRFEPRIYIPLPDKDARRQLFGIHSGKWGEMLSEGDLEELAEMTEGFSGSDIANVIKHALSVPLQKAQGSKWFKVVRFFLFFIFIVSLLDIANITIRRRQTLASRCTPPASPTNRAQST
jgi:vacuolar protein-sorting-associated protein 4